MQRRLIGSVFVVAAGLLPALIGGPVFALLMVGLGILSLGEFLTLGRDFQFPVLRWCLYGALALVGVGALIGKPTLLFLGAILAVIVPLGLSIRFTPMAGAAETWAWGAAGACYLGLPVFAAITLRQAEVSEASSGWSSLAEHISVGWPPAPGGMAWILAVVLSTWAGDSAAYLAGRAFGRRKLAPVVSPGKTVEGSLGGLLAAILVSVAVFELSGTLPGWSGAVVGAVIGACGQVGDLSESFLKRQASVKDSGTLIPGHGGVLDRIDALLFAFPAALMMYWIVEGGVR